MNTDAEAISTIWSPLYSWILGLGLWVFQPSRSSEAMMVHGIHLLLFVVALAAFSLFLAQLVAFARERPGAESVARVTPDWAWLVLGFSLFTWSSLELVGAPTGTPDMLGEAAMLAGLGVVLRIKRGHASPQMFALLGLILVLGYLAKAFFFLLAPLFIIGAIVGLGAARKRRLLLAGVSAAVFLVICGPWVVLVSSEAGRPSFSELGNFAYVAYVNGVPDVHYQGGPPDPGAPPLNGYEGNTFPQGGIDGIGPPIHPTRQLERDPPVFEYAEPVGGTYPPFYDPGYWYEGVRLRLDPGQQIAAIVDNVKRLQARILVVSPLWLFPVFFLLLAAFSGRRWRALGDVASFWPVLLPPLALMATVLLVYVEGRYLGAIPPVLWMTALASQRALPGSGSAGTFTAGAALLAAALTFPLIQAAPGWLSTSPDDEAQIAEGLVQRGVEAGDSVAVMPVSGTGGADWARRAGVRIVGEIQQPERFWRLSAGEQTQLLGELGATSGATDLVTDAPPPASEREGWTQVPGTDHYVRPLGT